MKKGKLNIIKKLVKRDGVWNCKLNYFEIKELNKNGYMCFPATEGTYNVEKA